MLNKNIKHIHCIGVGGIGVSGLAEALHRKGYTVSGSDLSNNAQIQHLQSLGITLYHVHQASNIIGADLIIYSSAIAQDNPEYIAALKAGIPTLKRGQALAELMNLQYGIAIAGTHGKTTTTGMVAHILTRAGLDPSYMIGGVIHGTNSPAYVGAGDLLVAEADESDASFLFMHPHVAVITNIDADHMETYSGDFSQLKLAFIEFANQVSTDGVVIACGDDSVIREIIPTIKRKVITYGFDQTVDYRIEGFTQAGLSIEFSIHHQERSWTLKLPIPGQHNALNATAAFIIAEYLKANFSKIQSAFSEFQGMGRRFESHGTFHFPRGQALLLEDYGHHPKELEVTLAAARSAWPSRRIVWVFQPHRYTRTRDLLDEFATVLSQADNVILTDIYAASETPIPGIDSTELTNRINKIIPNKAILIKNVMDLPQALPPHLSNNDVVIFQGAGSIGGACKAFRDFYE